MADILDLPYARRSGTAYEVVQKIQQAMTKALLIGERVSIKGFGIFSLRVKPATRSSCYYFYGKKKGPWAIVDIPAKTYVHFEPSKVLLRILNNGN